MALKKQLFNAKKNTITTKMITQGHLAGGIGTGGTWGLVPVAILTSSVSSCTVPFGQEGRV